MKWPYPAPGGERGLCIVRSGCNKVPFLVHIYIYVYSISWFRDKTIGTKFCFVEDINFCQNFFFGGEGRNKGCS